VKKLVKLGKWLLIKRNFMIYGVACGGTAYAIAMVLFFIKYDPGILFLLFVVVVSYLGAYLSTLLMWVFYAKHYVYLLEGKNLRKKGT